MRQALSIAEEASALGEVPVGCVIVDHATGHIIGRGGNRRQIDHDPTAHAEIVALREAAAARKSWRLDESTLYVTLEPCPMCAGALVNARVSRVVYGCGDPKAGAVRTLFQLCDDSRLNHRLVIESGVLAEACASVLSEFFRAQRRLGKK
jgi:tRNA(adenine34) deaminase